MQKNNNILLSLYFPPPFVGGSQTYIYNLIKRLKDINIIIYTWNIKDCEYIWLPENVIVKRRWYINLNDDMRKSKVKKLLMFIFWFIDLFFEIVKNRPKLILVAEVFPPGFLAYLFKILFNIPYVLFVYGEEITQLELFKFRKKLIVNILKSAQKIITVSKFTEKLLCNLEVEKEKIIIIRPSVDIELFRPMEVPEYLIKKFKGNAENIILSVGRLTERKGHIFLLRVLKEIEKEFNNLKLIIIGKDVGLGPTLKKEAELLNLKEKVYFLQDIPFDELPYYYNLCDLFVLPCFEIQNKYDTEGFGIVFLEANACKKPVVGGIAGGTAEAIENNVSGFLVNAQNIEELKEAVLKILRNPDLARKMGEEGYKRIQNEFDWNKGANILKEIILNYNG